MITAHLSEEQIQEFALGEAESRGRLSIPGNALSAETIEAHISACASCRSRVEFYRQLFSAIREQDPPILDFDPADLVLREMGALKPSAVEGNAVSTRIESVRSQKSFRDTWIIILALLGLGIPLFLMRANLAQLISGTSSILMYGGVMVLMAIALFQGVDIYRNYQRKIDALDLY